MRDSNGSARRTGEEKAPWMAPTGLLEYQHYNNNNTKYG